MGHRGFAIPAEIGPPDCPAVEGRREIERGYSASSLAPINEEFSASLGLPRIAAKFVQTVQDDSPDRARAGKPGDIAAKATARM